MIKKNKALFYLLPLLGQPTAFYSEALTNAFIGESTSESGEASYKFILEFNKEYLQSPVYDTVLEFIKNNPYYITKYSKLGDDASVYYVFRADFIDEFDLQKFINGEYSKLSDKLKQSLSKYYVKNSKIYSSLYPTEKDRKELAERLNVYIPSNAEIISKPNKSEEFISQDMLVDSREEFLL